MALAVFGLAAVGGRPPPAPQTGEELVALWDGRLTAGARNKLAELVRAYPRGPSRGDLAQAVNIEASCGTFAKYLSTLRSNGLVESHSGELARATPSFQEAVGERTPSEVWPI